MGWAERRLTAVAVLVIAAATLVSGADDSPAEGTQPIPLVIETSAGNIDIVVFPDRAPITVANFLRYVDEGYYDGTIVHRIVKRQLIGFAGVEKDLKRRPTYDPIKSEADNGLLNDRGTLAMWRGLRVNGATSEFYINMQNNHRYNHRGRTAEWFGNAVFGKITSDLEPLIELSRQPHRAAPGYERLPKETIEVFSIRRVTPDGGAAADGDDRPATESDARVP